ncbi:MAG TPA: alpha-mannosidase, partial [Clostridiales bacterium]|nr:alpha-mannosidase [Clostridiales bacterium]
TQKISWNTVNPFPHQSFKWKGLDGSHVLAHFFPENTYNGRATPKSAADIEKNYIDKDVSCCALMVYGDGDGGGGPGETHLENLKRMENLLGIPPVKPGQVTEFIKEWEKDASKFQEWKGELYLECHHGTYTTLGRNKRYNRKAEVLLRDIEWKTALADYMGLMPYPKDQLDAWWKKVLFNQFHDVIPGSSIKRVYDESWEEYETIIGEMEEFDQHLEQKISEYIYLPEDCYIVWNSLSWDRNETICLGEKHLKVTLPSMGYAIVNNKDFVPNTEDELSAEENRISNGILDITFDDDGTVASVIDVITGIEQIPKGEKGNRLSVYRDIGDAWDFIPSYREFIPHKPILTDKRFYIDGIRACGEFHYLYEQSVIQQKVYLIKGDPLLRFDTFADWRNKETMLRTSFPHDLLAEEAVCDIQFGNIRRPTTANSTQDMAKDEIPA